MVSRTVRTLLSLGLVALCLGNAPLAAQPSDLLLSEYIEGSSLNKAIEIYNGTGSAIDLSAGMYLLEIYFNGSSSAGTTIVLSGTVADGDVHVVADDGAAAAILAEADQTPTSSFFNGDDAVVLRKGGVAGPVVDSIGQVGFDPGSQWGSGLTSTQDNTLVRQADACVGDTDPSDVFDPAVDYDGFAQDDFTHLGSHTASCAAAVPIELSELRIDQSGADDDEYFELAGAPAASLDGLTYLVIGDGAGGSGVIENVTDLAGQVIPASGYFVAAEGTFTLGVADLTTTLSFENSDNVTHLVVRDFTGSNADDLDTDDDGTLDVTPWSEIVDCVALIETVGSGDLTYCADSVGPDGSFVPGQAFDCAGSWQIGTFDPLGATDTPGAANACPVAVELSEIRIDQSGADDDEFFELAGTPSASLNGLTYLVIGDGTGGSGVIENVTDLAGLSIPASGYFVAAETTFSLAVADLTTSLAFENSDNVTHLVVRDFTGANADDLDTDDDGTLDVTPWSEVVDCVALIETVGSGELTYCPDSVGPDGVNVPGLAYDCMGSWQIGTFDPLGTDDTPGAANACGGGGPVTAEIFEIQGSGPASPFVGQVVTTQANVVTAVGLDGFFIQTPDARADADVETSNGIYVFEGAAPTVSVGDVVDVTGTVAEFFDFTEIGTSPTVTATGTGALPTIVVFDATLPSPVAPQSANELERFEGMRISVPSGVICSGNQSFGSDPVAEPYVTSGPSRCFREPGILYPGLPGLPVWDGDPELFELDPDKLGGANPLVSAGSTFTAEGVLGYEFGGYELFPTALSVTPAALPVPVPARASGEMTVGSLNLFRLFDDIDDPVDPAGRNDTVVPTAEYLRRLAKHAAYIVDVLDAPDVLGVEEAEKVEVLDALAAAIAGLDPTLVYTAYLVEGNDIGTIDVGFLVRDTVQVDAVTQLGASEIFAYDGSLLHDRPPLLLEGRYVADPAVEQPLAMMVNHTRSLGGIDDPADGDRVRNKRLAQAQSIAQKVQDFQVANPEVPLVLIGDFNAFQFSDGYVDVVGQIAGDFDPTQAQLSGPDLVSPDLTKQVTLLPAAEQYSFLFQGDAQVLDHALTSSVADLLVTGFAYGRGNADAPLILIEDDTGPELPLRSSDHDGLALYLLPAVELSVTKTDGLATAAPGDPVTYTIVVANGGPATVLGATVADVFPAEIVGATWSCIASAGASCTAGPVAGDLLDLVDLPAGGTATYTVTGSFAATALGAVSNTATVTSTAPDLVSGNESATDVTTLSSPSDVTATKSVSGTFVPGGHVVYAVVLSNQSASAQLDDPASDELVDVLPVELALTGAWADSGVALADPGTGTVTWNGSIPGGGAVTITIEATIVGGSNGQVISNQGTVWFDADGDGANDTQRPTDDPAAPGADDPTAFVLGSILEIPTVGEMGLALLALLLALAGIAVSRRRAVVR